MASGWIKLDRKLLENEIWNVKPFSWGQAWVDLLLLANHADHVAIVRASIVNCKRGEVNRSQRQLAERWGWSTKKVRNFLRTLEGRGMVHTKVTTKETVITIEKYDVFQKAGNAKGNTFVPTEETLGKHSGIHTRREKNDKEGEEDARARESNEIIADQMTNVNKDSDIASASPHQLPPTLKDLSKYCSEENLNVDVQRFASYYASRDWKTKTGKPIKDWKRKLRDWHEADLPDLEEEKKRLERVEQGRRDQAEREAKLEEEFRKEFEKRKNDILKVI